MDKRNKSDILNLRVINQKYRKTILELDHYRDQVTKLEVNLKVIQSDLTKVTQERDHFKKSFENIETSASYQLGHLLIHEIRSISDLLRLPKKIINIKRRQQFPAAQFSDKNIQTLIQHKKFTTLTTNTDLKTNIDFSQIFKTDKKTHELKIACIMDSFTYGSYSPEAIFQQLTPNEWENELKAFEPDLIFIESAWRGKDELWWNAVGKKCDELVAIVKYCNKHNIPTVFWNKEDPVHFNTFINTAALFDFVFTTDIDMIDAYKTALEHDRVHLLTFACQPIVNNPLEKYERKDAFCFAGAYYVRYPDRTKDLDEFMLHLPKIKAVEIYDRNYGKDDPTYMFPDAFKPYIVGTLPFEEIDKAYKGYNYAINLNSVKQSQSMFARRVYEVLASNTITISNFSRAVRILFGDLVITSDSGTECVDRVQDLIKDEVSLKKHKLIALRKVLSEHTYRDRLEYLVSKVFNKEQNIFIPLITVICFIKSEEAYQTCLKNFDRQKHHNKRLLVISDHSIDTKGRDDIEIMAPTGDSSVTIAKLCPESDYITLFDQAHYYGAYYLTDMALATHYFDGDIIGKSAYYEYMDNNPVLNTETTQYHIVNSLPIHAALIKKDSISNLQIHTLHTTVNSNTLGELECLSIDEFNYCKNGKDLNGEQSTLVDAIDIQYPGISMKTLIRYSEKDHKTVRSNSETTYLPGSVLSSSISNKNISKVTFKIIDEQTHINSTMPSEKHQNIYNADLFALDTHHFGSKQKIYLDMSLGLSLQFIVVYYDEEKQKISHQSIVPNQNSELLIPENTKWVQFGFRIQGPGNVTVKALELAHRVLSPSVLIGQAEHLVLTNLYPSYNDLYRNGFVHARVKAYQEHGTNVDVFTLQDNTQTSYYEFENVNVINGSSEALRTLLETNSYKSILVHFLNEPMWDVLKDYINKINIFVWVHGAEVQPWTRRKHLFETDKAIEKAKIQSEKRISFWKELLGTPYKNLNLIFVSQYLAKSVMEDLKLTIPKENYKIVHNFINTDLFNYIAKNVEQRKKILSIRPYANANYANDLSVKVILELSKKPYFNELEFRLIGDGILFDEILEPLRQFDNVIIEKRFLSQNEIADLHKEYGIFLCPSRMDTQGVSRDEAMSSGLVPVTNAVTAIPEFVDDSCGMLAESEDAHGLAEGIAKLYENPELFQNISEAAAKRVREQCSFDHTIGQELNIFNLPEKKERKRKILIFGSCVSRDIFNLPNDFSLADYYARSSFASIFQPKFIHPEIADQLESKFQTKIVKADMEKSILSALQKNDFDILLLDFIDERFNLFEYENTICTLSNEAVTAGIKEKYPKHKLIKSSSDQFFEMWEKGWKEFIELMQAKNSLEKVILNKVYWAEETLSGEIFEPTYPKHNIQKMNKMLDHLYCIAERSLPPENIMNFSKELMVGADEHQWGKSPFHYVDEYYESALNFLDH